VVELEFEGQQKIVVKFWGFSPKVVKYLTLVRMALFVPRFRMAKFFSVLAVPFFQLI
jgi:hypothetical protein